MSWRGMEGGIAAARQGHDVVMAPTSFVYLDYYQGDPRFEPPAIGGFLPLRTVYAFEPTPAGLSEQEAAHILGGQANLWTEYIATPEHAATMMWPRLGALAEAVWSAPAGRDWDSFLSRLGRLRRGLESLGLRLAGTTWRPVISAAARPATRSWQVEMASDLDPRGRDPLHPRQQRPGAPLAALQRPVRPPLGRRHPGGPLPGPRAAGPRRRLPAGGAPGRFRAGNVERVREAAAGGAGGRPPCRRHQRVAAAQGRRLAGGGGGRPGGGHRPGQPPRGQPGGGPLPRASRRLDLPPA